MTRTEFINEVNDFYDLKDFCGEVDCNVCDDIIDSDQYDSYVSDDIENAVGNYSWEEIRDFLWNLPQGWDFYRCNASFDYDYMNDDDFQQYKDDVMNWMDRDSCWDEEEMEEVDGDAESDGECESSVPDEDFSIGVLLEACGAKLVSIERSGLDERKQEDEELAQLMNQVRLVAGA